MTMFYLVRHGEATYNPVVKRNFIGHGMDLAPLTENGVRQLKETSRDQRLKSCEIIVSSPYTRALQSAAMILICAKGSIQKMRKENGRLL